MNITEYLKDGKYILPDNPKLQYCGRMGRANNGMPEMVFPCSYVKWRFRGSSAAVIAEVQRFYFDVYMGCFIDGVQYTIRLEPGMMRIDLLESGKVCKAENIYPTGSDDVCGKNADDRGDAADAGSFVRSDTGECADDCHEIIFFKRQDACNIVELCGIELDKDAVLLECEPLPRLKMEVYGDSVSAGEVSEALDRAGMPDPEGHEGRYSNSWFSYSWIAARKLNAQLHDIAQGGIPLLDGTGWFGASDDLIGMESIYDRIRYYPDRRNTESWDFSKYTADVVVVAFGQNDAHPDDYMKTLREAGALPGSVADPEGSTRAAANNETAVSEAQKKADNWKKHYAGFLKTLRGHYPNALIVCTTTILCHDPAWDEAIDEVVRSMGDEKIRHFLYSKNGAGTPGHIRANEAEVMAQELADFIRPLIGCVN